MEYLLTGSEMSACDRRTSEVIGIPSLVLMERAALSVADGVDLYLRSRGNRRGPVLVAAGRGNNGADGLAAARILTDRGYEVTCFRLSGEISPASSFAVQEGILDRYGIRTGLLKDLMGADAGKKDPAAAPSPAVLPEGFEPPAVIIDALFGTGLSRNLEGEAAEAVAWLNACRDRCGAYTVAVDIPSGISSDKGAVMGCAVRCDETRTFAFWKRGHRLYPGAAYAGRLHLAQIGITPRSFAGRPGMFTLSPREALDLLPARDRNGNKGSFGKVLVIAGRKNMCGAAILAGRACLSAGAGMVKIFTHESNRLIVQQQFPEALLDTFGEEDDALLLRKKLEGSLAWADVAAAGPAMGTDETAHVLLRTLLGYQEPGLRGLVLDADALRLIALDDGLKELVAGRRQGLPCILTPHLAEFAALAGRSVAECTRDRSGIVQRTADALGCTIVCKDARTLAARPSREGAPIQYLNCTGNDGMATAGSGDVLTGMTAALLAAFVKGAPAAPLFDREGAEDGFEAAVCAVCLHGAAGDLARSLYSERGMTAMDLVTALRTRDFWEGYQSNEQ